MRTVKTKICNKCNDEKTMSEFYYNRSRKKYMDSCKKCNSERCVEFQKRKRNEGDVKYVLTQRAGSIRRDKKKKGVIVAKDLSKILYDVWVQQNGKCFYSGEPMEIQGYHYSDLACTVDRKVPELGYVEGNVVLCCAIVNKIKTNLKLEELFDWIEKMQNHLQQNKTHVVLQ